MSILANLWNQYLFIPLLNVLMILYSGPAGGNLGYAVILLTVALRVALLPLNIISLKGRQSYAALEKRVAKIRALYKNDSVLMRERLRQLLKKYRFSPWAKFAVLMVQVLVFVLLYQVFINGITRTKLDLLYPGVYRPDVINTDFYGFDLGAHSLIWSGAVGLILFLEIYQFQHRRKKPVTPKEALYGVLFPFMVFLLLWALPMVKSLFVLTSIFFSYILAFLTKSLLPKEASS